MCLCALLMSSSFKLQASLAEAKALYETSKGRNSAARKAVTEWTSKGFNKKYGSIQNPNWSGAPENEEEEEPQPDKSDKRPSSDDDAASRELTNVKSSAKAAYSSAKSSNRNDIAEGLKNIFKELN